MPKTHLWYTTQNGHDISLCGLTDPPRMVREDHTTAQRNDPSICRTCARAIPAQAAAAGIPGRTAT
jgi:hypothetical protein